MSLSIYPFISNSVLKIAPSFLGPEKRFKKGILLNIVLKIFWGTIIPLEFKYLVSKSILPLKIKIVENVYQINIDTKSSCTGL